MTRAKTRVLAKPVRRRRKAWPVIGKPHHAGDQEFLVQDLEQSRFTVALEITPPRRPQPKVLLRRAGLIGGYASAINVIQRPDRQSSLTASLALRQAGLHPVWHLVNRGRGYLAIEAEIAAAVAGGVRQVLCIRGDHTAGDRPDTPPLRAVIAGLRDAMPRARIGATLNQYSPDSTAVFRNLIPKLAAGADYVQTQPVFDAADLRPFAERLKEASPRTDILPMVIPLLSTESAERIAARLGIVLPERFTTALDRGDAEAGWRLFVETLAALVDAPWANGVAVMTAEIDPPADSGRRIIAALRATGAVPPSALPPVDEAVA